MNEVASGDVARPSPPSDRGSSALSPALRAAWLLRTAAIVSVLAATLAVVVEPGARGIATDAVVRTTGQVTWAFAYFMCGLLCTAVILGCYEASHASRPGPLTRSAAIGAAAVVVAGTTPALLARLPAWVSIAVALGAVIVALVGAVVGLQAEHTRAIGAVMGTLALAAALRIGAWE